MKDHITIAGHDSAFAAYMARPKTVPACPGPGVRGVRPELLRTVDGQGFRAVPFDPSEDADETRNQSTS